MERKKIIKEIALGLICISLLVSIGFNIFLYKQMKQVTPGVDQESLVNSTSVGNEISRSDQSFQKNATQSTTFAAKREESNKNDSDDLNYQLGAAEEELDMSHEQLSDELSKKSEFANNVIEQQKKNGRRSSLKKNKSSSI